MRVAGKRYITYSNTTKDFYIWCFADIHMNNRACAIEKCRRDIEKVRKDPYSFWVGGGDYAEYISYKDRERFDPENMTDDLKAKDLGKIGKISKEKVRKLFHPIRKKSLGLGIGNHEDKYMREQEQQDLHKELCEELGNKNLDLGYSALFDIVFIRVSNCKIPKLYWKDPMKGGDRHQFRFYIHHGAGAAATPAGKLNRLIKFMNYFDGVDVFMI
ncbi:unnamed protein product, partial [marine sediment metagenome]